MVRPMVHSEKHIVQFSINTITGGQADAFEVATGVPVASKDAATEVEEGSTIKAVYLEVWVRAGSTTPSSGQMCFYKRQSSAPNPSTTNMAALNAWDNKRNIFYTTMGLFNDQDADAIVIFKGWIKIPKGKQRMANGDNLTFTIFSPTIDLQMCGFALYKEYK